MRQGASVSRSLALLPLLRLSFMVICFAHGRVPSDAAVLMIPLDSEGLSVSLALLCLFLSPHRDMQSSASSQEHPKGLSHKLACSCSQCREMQTQLFIVVRRGA